ncbi:MAG TPA: hypothetical protein VGQ50_09985 [Actinomycetota bacterium]|jgi:hypothetical protein|nr:hypothetical protein [Actinomycetota bacterium]
MRGWIRVVGVAFGVVVLVAGTALAATPVKVLDKKGVMEFGGSQIDGWLAWDQNSKAHPKRFHTYVQPDGGSAVRVPIKGGTRSGDLIQTGPRAGQLVFEALSFGKGDIRFYDPNTDTVLKAPKGINTSLQEFAPRSDGDYLVFDRLRADGSWNIELYQYSTKKLTVIGRNKSVGQINGDYISLFICTRTTCNVWRYQISTGHLKKAPSAPAGRANYWSGVAADGTLYWVQGSYSKCGIHTKIKQMVGGTVTTVVSYPNGNELAALEARTLIGGPQVLFTRIQCSAAGRVSNDGIYKVSV